MPISDPDKPAVTERSFDEYHLYTLERAVTLRDHETKQVEFVRATGVHSQRMYVYALVEVRSYAGTLLRPTHPKHAGRRQLLGDARK